MKLLAAASAVATLSACVSYGDPGPAPAPGMRALPPTLYQPSMPNARLLNRGDRLPLARDHVVVFVGPNCRFCDDAIRDARSVANVRVDILDVTTGFGAQQFAGLGVGGTLPTVVANSQVMVGYEPNLLRQLLGGAGMRENNQSPP